MALILVIDDDGIVRDALTAFLTRAGHRVITAADGANGVLSFRNSSPDLVILDRVLPVMSGSGVFDSIRRISKKVPIIILSGYDEPEEMDAYLRSGAVSFFSKGDGLSNVLAGVNRALGEAPPERTGAGLVLVADDEAGMRAILARSLSSFGCSVIQAEDGAAALELARVRKPDIVLLDISMPKKGGVEVLKELAPEMPGTGFMMLSGNEDEDLARECLSAGAFDYIAKPLNLCALGEVIKARLLVQRA